MRIKSRRQRREYGTEKRSENSERDNYVRKRGGAATLANLHSGYLLNKQRGNLGNSGVNLPTLRGLTNTSERDIEPGRKMNCGCVKER